MERALGVELSKRHALQDFKDRDARWRLVERCISTLENRSDADFAFMATYTSLAAHGTLRHLPLGQALGEVLEANSSC